MKQSAGILVYKRKQNDIFVLLVHPGGPFFAKKDNGSWTIPKGEFDTEEPLEAARREFYEETGRDISGEFVALEAVTQKGGKRVYAWAVEGELDVSTIKSNTFEIEWPPRSGKKKEFPEIDRAEWFSIEDAYLKLLPAQHPFLARLTELLK